jgi:uncharacterized protein
MNALMTMPSLSDEAKRRVKPMFLAAWVNVLFIHFEVDRDDLADHVPLELDLHEGKAYVSIVAFTQKRLRPTFGGKLAEWLSRPLAQHEFLNVRTYVRVGSERGIFFMVEWVPKVLAKMIGPRVYGLPYRLGRLQYHVQDGVMRGVVEATGRLEFKANVSEAAATCDTGSLDEFLLERYTAFTSRNGVIRRFRISHQPWPQARVHCRIIDDSLLTGSNWTRDAHGVGAHFSRGVRDVAIGAPQRLHRRDLAQQL